MPGPIHRETHPRSCCVCNQYRLPAEYHLIRIDYHDHGSGLGERSVTLSEAQAGYAGIRTVCVDCLSGLASLARTENNPEG